jgi:hypothetical protein
MLTPFTFVIGPPSGGTSAVAGVLHHLGVNMGDNLLLMPSKRQFRRRYPWYEPKGRTKIKTPTQLHAYVTQRMMTPGPHGAKYPWWTIPLANSDWVGDGFIRLLAVHRPHVDVMASHRRYYDRADWGMWEDRILKYHESEDLLFERLAPVAYIEYYDLLSDPYGMVEEIADALDLVTTPEQFQSAIEFIDPRMRNV